MPGVLNNSKTIRERFVHIKTTGYQQRVETLLGTGHFLNRLRDALALGKQASTLLDKYGQN